MPAPKKDVKKKTVVKTTVDKKQNKDIKSLTAKVKKINLQLSTEKATHTQKWAQADNLFATENIQAYNEWLASSPGLLESGMTNFRYFNPAAPNVPVVADVSTRTQSAPILVESQYAMLKARNNYLVPVDIAMYLVAPRGDTSITPLTTYTNGLTDQNAPLPSSTLMFLTDSDQFNKNWKILKSIKKRLGPGSEASLNYSTTPFRYNTAVYDSHALTYQSKWKSAMFVLFVNGVVAHDSVTAGQNGLSPAGVDTELRRKTVFKYDAGMALNDFSLGDGYDSMTALARISQYEASNQSADIA